MTSQSENLGLTYWELADGSVLFQDFRTGLASSGSASNMYILDSWAGSSINSFVYNVDATTSDNYAYSASGISFDGGITLASLPYPTGTKILLSVNTENDGDATLSINGETAQKLYKTYKTGTETVLLIDDLQHTRKYLFEYNSSKWILLNSVGLPQLVSTGQHGDLVYDPTLDLWTIAPNVVSISKMTNITPNRLLGSTAVGGGAVQELSPSQVIDVLSLANAFIYLGDIDCTVNPNYPAASAGDTYIISGAGKIGGVYGRDVNVGDVVFCNTDDTPTGGSVVNQYWDILQGKIDGDVVITSASLVADSNISVFSGTSGSIIGDSGISSSSVALKNVDIRELLTSNRTYYVATTGSDSNDGSSGNPFLTIQKAINTAAALDTSLYDITISVDDGTYVGNITLKNILGNGTVTIQGNTGNMNAVVIDGEVGKSAPGTTYYIEYVKFAKSASTRTNAISLSDGASVYIGNVNFGVQTTAHIYVSTAATINTIYGSGITISGSAPYHAVINKSGNLYYYGATVTVSGTPDFSASFIWVTTTSQASFQGTTFTGSATGKRYNCTFNGVAYTYGGGATYLPGDVAGTTSTGGQYA